ncbi:Fic/DOC family protein [Psychroflexus planctonicus]|uniref:protein adenylyltransferase n=1 Tax=Psychroflexus planctonicus TaxID=1526575 RepID=A0ABQ1SM29_9FLAO|nr:Fic family protein [Psychroflexus planctonicus]GGE45370.1 cell filamentation protein Fic [Psychroflexus planctonicus]
MSNSYRYVDPDYTYIDPKSGVLKNLADITNSEDLLFFESVTVTKRINELHNNPIKINGIESLFSIHQHLFQDIYDWAGKKRLVEISKDGKQFFPTSHFENACNFIDTLIESFKKTKRDDRNEIAEKLAEILDNVNYLHPFIDGNGRAQREFLRMLALEKGISLNLNPPDDENVYERYMQGTVNSDVKILKELIFELIS